MKKLLKKVLPASLILKLLGIKPSINLYFIRLVASNGFLASLYFTFFSSQFRREHKAVLQGRLAYARSLKQIGVSCVLLRRNIHRLEKGLIMQPRRKIFAEDYIGETVNCYLNALNSKELCTEERKWATDVLAAYFSVVGSSKLIDAARRNFQAVNSPLQGSESIPYPHKTLPECPVSYQQLYTLFQRRRSVRWYQPIPVADSLIQQAVQAAALAPSACNRQPFRFYVVNDAAKAATVAQCAMGTVGFADNLQCVIAVVGDLSAYPDERDRHVIYIDGALAAMQLMLACETLGLSTCPINWPDIEQREQMLAQKLGLAYYQRTIMLLAVGYAQADGGIAFSQKKVTPTLIKDVSKD